MAIINDVIIASAGVQPIHNEMKDCDVKLLFAVDDGKSLGSDPHGLAASQEWSHWNTVGLLSHLSSNFGPDIAFDAAGFLMSQGFSQSCHCVDSLTSEGNVDDSVIFNMVAQPG